MQIACFLQCLVTVIYDCELWLLAAQSAQDCLVIYMQDSACTDGYSLNPGVPSVCVEAIILWQYRRWFAEWCCH